MKNMVNFPFHKEHDIQDGTYVYLVGLPLKPEFYDLVRLEHDDILVSDGFSKSPTEAINRHYLDSENVVEFSVNYRFAICIGYTDKNWHWEDWVCAIHDLNEEGRNLFYLLSLAYQDCNIYILTFSST